MDGSNWNSHVIIYLKVSGSEIQFATCSNTSPPGGTLWGGTRGMGANSHHFSTTSFIAEEGKRNHMQQPPAIETILISWSVLVAWLNVSGFCNEYFMICESYVFIHFTGFFFFLYVSSIRDDWKISILFFLSFQIMMTIWNTALKSGIKSNGVNFYKCYSQSQYYLYIIFPKWIGFLLDWGRHWFSHSMYASPSC